MTSTSPIDKLIELTAEIKNLEAQLDDMRRERTFVERVLLDEFENNDIQKISKNGVTVYRSSILFASPAEGEDRDSVAHALKEAGLGDLVKEQYNANQLSAWVREQVGQGDALPESVANVLRVYDKPSIRIVRGSK